VEVDGTQQVDVAVDVPYKDNELTTGIEMTINDDQFDEELGRVLSQSEVECAVLPSLEAALREEEGKLITNNWGVKLTVFAAATAAGRQNK
jgi:hypothetical protein